AGVAFFPLGGPSTLAYVPALVVWLLVLAWYCRSGTERRRAWVLGGSAVTAVLMVGLYFLNYRRDTFTPDSAHPVALVRGAVEVLSMSLTCDTVATQRLGPGGPHVWVVTAAALLLLLVASAGLLVVAWWRNPREHVRALGLLFFLGGAVCLFLAVGKARTS